jgi:hypothetical protein
MQFCCSIEKADSQQPAADNYQKSPFAALIRFAGRPGKERTGHGCAL